jgi:hypothetical protein
MTRLVAEINPTLLFGPCSNEMAVEILPPNQPGPSVHITRLISTQRQSLVAGTPCQAGAATCRGEIFWHHDHGWLSH